ncbi:hypothetical protein [Streptomyces sp. NPDC018031]|uniref:hypothetical protein n=1 Tax=Streptomyces sp. NPDC018031 TaxID=3365033 RepID=UPI00379A5621
MAETAAHRTPARNALFAGGVSTGRRRRGDDTDRKNAAAALQRALDRRDNGGDWGHLPPA